MGVMLHDPNNESKKLNYSNPDGAINNNQLKIDRRIGPFAVQLRHRVSQIDELELLDERPDADWEEVKIRHVF
jgi:hypothetical protein